MRSAIGINHLLGNFSGYAAHAMLGLEVADDVTAERRRSSRFIFVIRPLKRTTTQR
jgi:hypothetical protein